MEIKTYCDECGSVGGEHVRSCSQHPRNVERREARERAEARRGDLEMAGELQAEAESGK